MVSDTVGHLDDCQAVFSALHRLTAPHGRIIVAYYMRWWNPILKLAEKLDKKMPQLPQNWLTTDDIMGLLDLANFDPIRREWRQLLPMTAFGLGNLINRVQYNYVIDFIDFYRIWPNVFNVADACVTVGVALLLISSFATRRHA